MHIQTRRQADALILRIEEKDFDVVHAAEFKEKAKEIAGNELRIVVDLAQVQFVDSSAMGALLSLARHVRRNGGNIKLAAASERVMVAFELIRLQKSIDVYGTVEAALSSFASA